MKKLKLLFFALICILPFSVNALEENTCEVFLKGTYEYTTEDEANLKKEWLEAKVESLNNGDGIFGDFRFSYKIEENDVSEMVKTNFETVNVSDKFTSKEDAVKHYDEITLDWGYVKENPTVLEHKEQLINKSEEVTVICNSDDCELEKQNIMEYPLVKAIMEEFKGAKIETLTRKVTDGEEEDDLSEFGGKNNDDNDLIYDED